MQSLTAQRLGGASRGPCAGGTCQPVDNRLGDSEFDALIIDFDDEGIAGSSLLPGPYGHGCGLSGTCGRGFAVEILTFQPFGGHAERMLFGGEFRIIENLLEQARRRRHAFDT